MTRKYSKEVLQIRAKRRDFAAYVINLASQDGLTPQEISKNFNISLQTFFNYKYGNGTPREETIKPLSSYYLFKMSVSLTPLEEDLLPTYNPQHNIEQKLDIEKGLKSLNSRERDVIECHFGFNSAGPDTLKGIGQEYGITRERIRQIEKEALGKLGKTL